MVNSDYLLFDRYRIMPEGLWPILIMIAAVIVYAIAKVIQYMRESEKQWQQVDKSKLKEWVDDD